jgi:23S rRNA pseudouridine1911/1915/1917 synthase
LFDRIDWVADPVQGPVRVDKFVIDRLSHKSRSKIQDAIRAGTVTVDGQPVKPNHKIRPGSVVAMVVPRLLDGHDAVKPQNIPLNIVFEDEHLMVINKPAGMAVHPGVGIPDGTLVNAITWHLQENATHLPVKAGNDPTRAGLVHRIDKDTTGLMVIAKDDFSMAHLAKQFFDHSIDRRYSALVWSDLDQDRGTITGNIGRSPQDRKKFVVFPEGDQGKHAVTHYEVAARYYYVTLIDCKLETGRTHQIRVHLKHIGHPLFGDIRYGGNLILKGTVYSKYRSFVEDCFRILPRQALHARLLGFTHPVTQERLCFESALPEDMQTVLHAWKQYVDQRMNASR